ncbi:MAG TPA: c-type cytochrome [Polyangiaceae bacterium]|nr:c-type cytochrome [Polyangiaceae bacterium]
MKLFSPAALVVSISLAATACREASSTPPLARGRELFELCAQCHGLSGGGNELLKAPAIAGQHAWYIATQLHKFKNGIRGKHPSDTAGLRMRAMALSLKSDEDIAAVAEYAASLPPEHLPSTVGGDAGSGAGLFVPCSACHGPDGKGDAEKKAPALVRANDWYLLSQLEKFKAHIRGSSPDDAEAALMLPWVQTLADPQAMKDVVAHVATLQ